MWTDNLYFYKSMSYLIFVQALAFTKTLSSISTNLYIFTDRSKAVLLLLINCVISVLCLSRLASVHYCPVVTCWERADILALVCGVKLCFGGFPCGILGQMWYLTVSIPNLCPLSYFGIFCP